MIVPFRKEETATFFSTIVITLLSQTMQLKVSNTI